MPWQKRFPADPQADRRAAAEQYHDAMREMVKQFPDDLDAAALFAESGMNLHPWGLWHVDGSPELWTGKKLSPLWSPSCGAILSTWAQSITTFTLWKVRQARNVPLPLPIASPLLLLMPDTSYTCPRTFTSAPAISNQE